MGFPVGYSEMPKLVLHLLFLLTHLRRLSCWLLRLSGLDIVVTQAAADDVWARDQDNYDLHHHHHHHHYHQYHAAADAGRRLEDHSPAVRFDSLSSAARRHSACAVCLGDFHAAAEVRRARGCRHVFHRACLDRWAAHGQHTCPLCRSPLLPPLPLPLPLPLPAS